MSTQIFDARITRTYAMTESIKGFELEIPAAIAWDLRAGQFVSILYQTDENKKPVKRPYSVASSPQENAVIKLCITKVGSGLVSNYMHDKIEGDTVVLQGPLGAFRIREPQVEELIFVSTGTGIAPFRSMILDLFHKGTNRKITLYHGNRYEDFILYHDDFLTLADQHENFHYCPCISRPGSGTAWAGRTGYVQNHIAAEISDAKNRQVYICGINAMIEDVKAALASIGFGKESIIYEKYD